MECRPVWFVQSKEDCSFLAPDGEGGASGVSMLSDAVAFDSRESAELALIDYFDGYGAVVQSWKPVDSEVI